LLSELLENHVNPRGLDKMPILRTENLSKNYSRGILGHKYLALKDLNLEVEAGEVFGFLGPNGAGKTTTLKLLLRLIYPSGGQAWIKDKPIGHASLVQSIGYMPENPYFYRFLTGEELLMFYGKLCHLPAGQRKERAAKLLDLVGLRHAAHVRVGQYSKGMVQRAGLAQALLHEPELILLDEPLSGLDPMGRSEMRQVLERLRGEGKTIFFCSHILSDVENVCNRFAILHRGRMIVSGGVDEILDQQEKQIIARVRDIDISDELKANILDMESSGNETRISLASREAADMLVRSVGAQSGSLLSLETRRMSLEEYFVSRIGEAIAVERQEVAS
jgi:ABC-2 type transport system ATP-binding protein